MLQSTFIIFVLLIALIAQSAEAFFLPSSIATASRTRTTSKSRSLVCSAVDKLKTEPTTPTTRLVLVLGGESVATALFRSDLNKEAVFRRGCAVKFSEKNSKKAEIVLEGKTKQVMRFIPWLMVLASELNSPQRKPNFQGPTIKITIDDAKWLPYVGDISGFVSTGASPVLGDTVEVKSDGMMEAKSMTGTDESV